MLEPKVPEDEVKRIEALKSFSILDTLPESEYDDITFLASQICKTPISLISLIDENRQWFKSHHGIEASFTHRNVAFCAHAINDKDNLFIVPDAAKDDRFHDNPLVSGEPYVVFYAGAPLVTSDGFPLGTLCVIDHEPHVLDEFQTEALRALSNQISRLFELRKKTKQLETMIFELEIQKIGLEKFASVAAHDIKSPLTSIVMLTDLIKENYSEKLDSEGNEFLQMISKSTLKTIQLIDGILKYSKNATLLSAEKEEISLNKLITELFLLIDPKREVEYRIESASEVMVYCNKIALEQIFINLFTNSIKYNDKGKTVIVIGIEDRLKEIEFVISDNGPGIGLTNKDLIFEIFVTNGVTDKFGEIGNGIGLATVKSLVEGLGGSIHLESEPGQGARFEFTIKK